MTQLLDILLRLSLTAILWLRILLIIYILRRIIISITVMRIFLSELIRLVNLIHCRRQVTVALRNLFSCLEKGRTKEEYGRYIRYSPLASRGAQYFFTYTATLNLSDGNYTYPEDYQAGTLLRSRLLDVPKQIPQLQFYPGVLMLLQLHGNTKFMMWIMPCLIMPL